MLQEALMPRTHLVELINIDQRKTIQIHFRIPLPAEVNTVGIISAKPRRYQIPAKGRLACPLRTYQQRGSTVRMLPIIPTPMSYHIEKPPMKKHHPMFIFTGNSVCQFSNPVFSIPVGQMKKKLFQRIIDRYTIGMQIPIDIPIPHRNPLALGIQQNTVLYSLIYRTKTEKE
jgi:hypothetical protein